MSVTSLRSRLYCYLAGVRSCPNTLDRGADYTKATRSRCLYLEAVLRRKKKKYTQGPVGSLGLEVCINYSSKSKYLRRIKGLQTPQRTKWSNLLASRRKIRLSMTTTDRARTGTLVVMAVLAIPLRRSTLSWISC